MTVASIRKVFDESQHPRDDHGRFGEGGGSGRLGASVHAVWREHLYSTDTGKQIESRSFVGVANRVVVPAEGGEVLLHSVLSGLDIPGLNADKVLAKFPFTGVVLRNTLQEGSNGAYYAPGDVHIATTQQLTPSGEPGQRWFAVNNIDSQDKALKTTILHEYGHHIMGEVLPAVEGYDNSRGFNAILDTYRGGRQAISKYAGTSPDEYFAETHAAYYTNPSELRAYDPAGYKMVETVNDVLAKAGLR